MNRRTALLIAVIVAAVVGVLVSVRQDWIMAVFHARQEEQVLNEPVKGKLMRLRVWSQDLRRKNVVFVYLPPDYSESGRPYPVVYLLHGFPGEARDWFVKGHAHLTAESKILARQIPPLILVSADAAGPMGPDQATEYLNSRDDSVRVEDYVSRELPDFIERRFNAAALPGARAVLGLSSGGYGAVNLGIKHPDRFRVIASHSGFFQLSDDARAANKWIGPPGPVWAANDPYKNVGEWPDDVRLHLYLDCGEGDELLDENREFSRRLTRLGIDHEFHVFSGSHRWLYWSKHVADSLQFVGDRFRRLSQPYPVERSRTPSARTDPHQSHSAPRKDAR